SWSAPPLGAHVKTRNRPQRLEPYPRRRRQCKLGARIRLSEQTQPWTAKAPIRPREGRCRGFPCSCVTSRRSVTELLQLVLRVLHHVRVGVPCELLEQVL